MYDEPCFCLEESTVLVELVNVDLVVVKNLIPLDMGILC